MTPIIDNTPIRFMVVSTIQKMYIFISICEKFHQDRDSVIDDLLFSYVREFIDDDELLKYVENIWNVTA